MIPAFDDQGYLPPGIYPATLEEVDARFGQSSEVRQAQAESLRWLLDLARQAGAERVIINGSFVTDILEPNDVDCVLLTGKEYPADVAAHEELLAGLPFIELHLVEQKDFDYFIGKLYATDRDFVAKGMIEVVP